MTDEDQRPYRPCVGIMLLNHEGLAFVGRRRGKAASPFEWQMPQGGIDKGEDPLAAALRELYEETNVSSAALLAEAPQWFSYELPPMAGGRGWTAKYRGQTQKWFALRFTGEDGEIDVEAPGGGAFKAEFDAWRWEDVASLPDLIVPFKRRVYEDVVATFRHLAA